MESRMDLWGMALFREDIRLYVSGSGPMSEIEAAEEQRPSGLPGVQSFGKLDEGMIFVVHSHSKWILIFLQPVFPFFHWQPDPKMFFISYISW